MTVRVFADGLYYPRIFRPDLSCLLFYHLFCRQMVFLCLFRGFCRRTLFCLLFSLLFCLLFCHRTVLPDGPDAGGLPAQRTDGLPGSAPAGPVQDGSLADAPPDSVPGGFPGNALADPVQDGSLADALPDSVPGGFPGNALADPVQDGSPAGAPDGFRVCCPLNSADGIHERYSFSSALLLSFSRMPCEASQYLRLPKHSYGF